MAVLVSQEAGETVNCKRMLRIMREEGILSSVRRREYTEEVYAGRRDFSAIEPGKRFVEDIPSLTCT